MAKREPRPLLDRMKDLGNRDLDFDYRDIAFKYHDKALSYTLNGTTISLVMGFHQARGFTDYSHSYLSIYVNGMFIRNITQAAEGYQLGDKVARAVELGMSAWINQADQNLAKAIDSLP